MITARDVYEVLGLPSGLRVHMARTVAVTEAIAKDGPEGASRQAREVALAMSLHDVGNIVKPVGDGSLLAEPPALLDRWRLYVSFAAARYGSDAHRASELILADLGVRQELIDLIDRKSSRNLPSILDKGDPAELLALYADMRVSPAGLVSIAERHEDATARYAGEPGRRGLGGDVTIAQLRELEGKVARRFGFDPSLLSPAAVDARIELCMELDLGDAFR